MLEQFPVFLFKKSKAVSILNKYLVFHALYILFQVTWQLILQGHITPEHTDLQYFDLLKNIPQDNCKMWLSNSLGLNFVAFSILLQDSLKLSQSQAFPMKIDVLSMHHVEKF